MRGAGWSRALGNLPSAVVVLAFAAWTLGPLYWMLSTSFKDPLEATQLTPTLWPARLTFENYAGLIGGPFPFVNFLINSAGTALAAGIITLLLVAPAGYSFSRGRYLLRGPLMYTVLATQMLPLAVLLVPLYLLFLRGGLLDTYQGVILGYCSFALPFGAWLMKGFIDAVPREIEEAAQIDGASRLYVLTKVVLPLAVPGLITTGIFTFMNAWNNLIYPLTFITSVEKQTLPPGLLLSFTGIFKTDWGGMMAASVVTTLPLAICFLLVQRYLVRGLTSGAVSGT